MDGFTKKRVVVSDQYLVHGRSPHCCDYGGVDRKKTFVVRGFDQPMAACVRRLFDQVLFTDKLAQSCERKPWGNSRGLDAIASGFATRPGGLWHIQVSSTSVGHITGQSAAV